MLCKLRNTACFGGLAEGKSLNCFLSCLYIPLVSLFKTEKGFDTKRVAKQLME